MNKSTSNISPDFKNYWLQAQAANIAQESDTFPTAFPGEISRFLNRYPRLMVGFHRFMGIMFPFDSDSRILVLLFNAKSCLIERFGSDRALQYAAQHGLLSGTDWSLDAIGPNAVAIGSREKRACISVGEDNYSALCCDFALYYVPLHIQQVLPPYKNDDIGGIAVLLPRQDANPDYLVLAHTFVHDLIYMVHFDDRVRAERLQSEQAILSAFTPVNEEPSISFTNDLFFDMFHIAPRDFYMHPLQEAIDPLPKNKLLWEIISTGRRVDNLEIKLEISGNIFDCILSSDFYCQPIIGARGINLFLMTQQEIAMRVSQKIGNVTINGFDEIIGTSPSMRAAVQRARVIANIDSNIMLYGESGVGKDIFARAIHNAGPRRSKPFIAINCGALPRDLIASELFGYEGGAFTGAKRQGNIGKFELANGGTLFLDEIGELPLDLQATLLRAVEQKTITRLGSAKEVQVDVRIICATNANLPNMLQQKHFREDLFFRLSTIHLTIPPLRERGNDIILLANYFIHRVSERIGRADIMQLSDAAISLLRSLPWRGNVRELQNMMECIVQLYPAPILQAEYIRENVLIEPSQTIVEDDSSDMREESLPISPQPQPNRRVQGKRIGFKKEELEDAMAQAGGNISAAAQLLGVSRGTVYRYMRMHDLI